MLGKSITESIVGDKNTFAEFLAKISQARSPDESEQHECTSRWPQDATEASWKPLRH
jgi:hypothetical protein